MQSVPVVYQRVYVKVSSEFDTVGCITPKSIEWKDGRVFQIEQIIYSHVGNHYGGRGGCYTVMIMGKQLDLFFEVLGDLYPSRFGRWYL